MNARTSEGAAPAGARARRPPACSRRPPARRRPLAARGPSFTALLFAVQLGQIDAVRALLEAGANVNDTLPDGTSALVLAAQNGHWELGRVPDRPGRGRQRRQAGLRRRCTRSSRIRRTNIGFLPPPVGKGSMSSTRSREEAAGQRRQRQRRDDQRLPRRLPQSPEPRRRDAVPAGGQERRHRADEGAAGGRRRIR